MFNTRNDTPTYAKGHLLLAVFVAFACEILYSTKFWRGKTLWRIWQNVTRQYFTQPNSRFTKVANISYCKFPNIFLAKTLKQLIRQSFTRQNFALYGKHVQNYKTTEHVWALLRTPTSISASALHTAEEY